VSANTTNNDAQWFIKNTGSNSVTVNSQTLSKSGNVTAVHDGQWVGFPFTMAPGFQLDADVFFDVGSAGTGTVGLSVSTSCGTKVFPTYNVTIN
jgi:hypothetical protein